MRDPGELIANTLVREFSEEALAQELNFDKFGKITNTFETKGLSSTLNNFFRNGTMVSTGQAGCCLESRDCTRLWVSVFKIYKGYVDDPRYGVFDKFQDILTMKVVIRKPGILIRIRTCARIRLRVRIRIQVRVRLAEVRLAF